MIIPDGRTRFLDNGGEVMCLRTSPRRQIYVHLVSIFPSLLRHWNPSNAWLKRGIDGVEEEHVLSPYPVYQSSQSHRNLSGWSPEAHLLYQQEQGSQVISSMLNTGEILFIHLQLEWYIARCLAQKFMASPPMAIFHWFELYAEMGHLRINLRTKLLKKLKCRWKAQVCVSEYLTGSITACMNEVYRPLAGLFSGWPGVTGGSLYSSCLLCQG